MASQAQGKETDARGAATEYCIIDILRLYQKTGPDMAGIVGMANATFMANPNTTIDNLITSLGKHQFEVVFSDSLYATCSLIRHVDIHYGKVLESYHPGEDILDGTRKLTGKQSPDDILLKTSHEADPWHGFSVKTSKDKKQPKDYKIWHPAAATLIDRIEYCYLIKTGRLYGMAKLYEDVNAKADVMYCRLYAAWTPWLAGVYGCDRPFKIANGKNAYFRPHSKKILNKPAYSHIRWLRDQGDEKAKEFYARATDINLRRNTFIAKHMAIMFREIMTNNKTDEHVANAISCLETIVNYDDEYVKSLILEIWHNPLTHKPKVTFYDMVPGIVKYRNNYHDLNIGYTASTGGWTVGEHCRFTVDLRPIQGGQGGIFNTLKKPFLTFVEEY